MEGKTWASKGKWERVVRRGAGSSTWQERAVANIRFKLFRRIQGYLSPCEKGGRERTEIKRRTGEGKS